MKKTLAVLLSVICLVSLFGCAKGKTEDVKIDYGASSIYSHEDMDAAIKVIKEKFSTWHGCELHTISYAGDEECSESELARMNQLKKDNAEGPFTQVIVFMSDFHTPKHVRRDAWEVDKEYTGWNWYLARTEGGSWKLIDWGY